MRALLLAIAVLSVAAGAAQAQTVRLSDRNYIALSRCAGLAEGSSVDAASVQSQLRSQRQGRGDHVRSQATEARQSAIAEIRAATGTDAERLSAERNVCLA